MTALPPEQRQTAQEPPQQQAPERDAASESCGVPRRDLLRGAGALGGFALSGLPLPGRAGEQAAAAGPASRAAYRELLQTLQRIGDDYLSPAWGVTSGADIAEGYRALLHFLDVGIRLYFEGNPERPEFQPIVSPTIKIQGDNPDGLYFHTRIRGDRNYRIRGRRVGETYLSFTVHSGDGDGGWATGVDAEKNFRQITFAADGSYELLVGPAVAADRGLRTGPHSQEIVTRHYFEREHSAQLDPELRPQLSIEALDAGAPPAAPDDAGIARRLRTVRNFLIANTTGRPRPDPAHMPAWFAMAPNQLGRPARWTAQDGGGLGAVDNAYSAGRFALAPDQALVIEGRLPACVFANIVLWNRYLQSFDYRYRRISLNRKQMQLEADGSYRIVIAARDPGLPNWLSTEGRPSGTMFWRFLLPEGDIETPRTRVVALADLRRA
jgi:hypothetical protein